MDIKILDILKKFFLIFREVFDRSEKGILGWKQTIKIDDVDYKGFTRMTCTDRCVIDFHPWCWKHKKDSEKCHLDKDYLKTYCPTPDCGAPIRQISLYKDDLENPYSLTDEEMTKKMLAEGMYFCCAPETRFT